MTITRLTPSHGVLAKIALPLLAGLLLVGCNNADPYNSGQKVSGTILEPSTVEPLNPSSPATQVALFVNKSVQGISYTCDDSHQTTYLTQVYTTGTGSSSDGLPVARCGNDAYSATFFLGLKDASNFSSHVDLGTIALPITTATGADGKVRFNPTQNDQSSSTFFYPFSVADMETSPARIAPDMSTANGRKLVYTAALLEALNASTSSDVLVIADGANQVAAYPNIYGNLVPANLFDYPDYTAFTTAWNPFLQRVSQYQQEHTDVDGNASPLPPIDGWPAEQSVIDGITQGASRLAAGNLSLDYSSLAVPYYLFYQNCIFNSVSSFSVNFLVYPSGDTTGFGVLDVIPGVLTYPNGASCYTPPDSASVGGFVFVGANPVSAGASYGQVDARQSLQHVQVQSIDSDGTENNSAAVNLFGRIFGDFLYDGRTAPAGSSVSGTDFTKDYPKLTNAFMTDADKGSATGYAFGFDLPTYVDGLINSPGKVGIGGADGRTPLPIPFRLSRSSRVQAAPLDASLLNALPDYYLIRLMRFCDQSEAGCAAAIPNKSLETGSEGNYLDSYCLTYKEDNSGNVVLDDNSQPVCDTTATVNREMPRPNALGGSDGDIYVKFDKSRVDEGIVLMELTDSSCVLRTNSNAAPYYLGFVSASQSGDASGMHASVSVNMLFTGSDRTSMTNGTIPQSGVSLSGRIDLSKTSMPMYRLGDDNFKEGLRARWVDSYKYRLYLALQGSAFPKDSQGNIQYDQFSNQQKMLFASLYWGSGAVSGQALDASCQPVP